MKRPVKEIFKYLVKDLKIPIDEIDNEGLNPFYIGIKSKVDKNKPKLSAQVKKLIEKGASLDLADRQGITPFLLLYSKQFRESALYLLDRGANIDAIGNDGDFALKLAVISRNNEEIEMLWRRGADVNKIDNHGRNLLHESVKSSNIHDDSTFETEQLIINLDVDINQRDLYGRVPLHYAFVKN